jgi:hypothetical protein
LNAKIELLQSGRFEKLMDLLVKHQERVMRAICDRFGRDLCLVSVRDDFLARPETVVDENYFQNSLLPRLERMIGPAREHGLPVALDTLTVGAQALPGLYKVGIGMIQSGKTDLDVLEPLAREWQGKLVFSGSLPASLLTSARGNELDEQIRLVCKRLTRQPGFVFSLDFGSLECNDVIPQNLVNAFRAVQRFGRYT